MAVTQVQNVANGYVLESSMTWSLSGVVAGHVLCLVCGNTVNNANFNGGVSGGGATWTQVQQIADAAGGAGLLAEAELWVGTGTTGGSITVTGNASASSYLTGVLFELAGASGVIDTSNTSSGSLASTLSSPSLTPTASGELMIAIITSTGTTTGATGSPWVPIELTFSGSNFGAAGYNPSVVNGTGAQFQATGATSAYYTSAAAIFKASGTFVASAPTVVGQAVKRSAFY